MPYKEYSSYSADLCTHLPPFLCPVQNPTRGQKREYPLPAPQDVAGEGAYAGQHAQSQYTEYFKKKRI